MAFLNWLLPLAAVAFSALLFYPLIRAKMARGKRLDAADGIDPALMRGRKLLYFMAPHCGMCRTTTPLVEALQQGRDDIVIVDASERPELARALHVMATPAFVVIDDGCVERVVVGAKSQRQIERLIDG